MPLPIDNSNSSNNNVSDANLNAKVEFLTEQKVMEEYTYDNSGNEVDKKPNMGLFGNADVNEMLIVVT